MEELIKKWNEVICDKSYDPYEAVPVFAKEVRNISIGYNMWLSKKGYYLAYKDARDVQWYTNKSKSIQSEDEIFDLFIKEYYKHD